VNLGLLYVPFVVFVLVGSSNAVNLTDGLDGLAIGATLIAAATYAIFTYIAATGWSPVPAGLLRLWRRRAHHLLRRAGRGLGGLPLVHSHPAEVFMGDVGSLALGGGIGIVAVIAKQELVLALSAACSCSRRCR